jgi:hypothetical protein
MVLLCNIFWKSQSHQSLWSQLNILTRHWLNGNEKQSIVLWNKIRTRLVLQKLNIMVKFILITYHSVKIHFVLLGEILTYCSKNFPCICSPFYVQGIEFVLTPFLNSSLKPCYLFTDSDLKKPTICHNLYALHAAFKCMWPWSLSLLLVVT